MKKLLVLSAIFSSSLVFAGDDVCMEIGKAQAINDHDRVIELAATINDADVEQCKMVAKKAREDATDSFETMNDE
ncbi:hypothetical protein VIN01S_15970 [Vibrio inusitatus NBRC 102082]|uniref:Uncharacterized protein n=1 Tax=Vibrio inusitatus NBRC 102082 TaxID=1219070 RepID=A0A4Y3HUF8_9VIBR|nr:hypothetical protein [Vibrio inusitatus]GEA50793.1 hypothetical protein VIN01S_15970 [Vibrio inusitatus NBRC 102082]